MSGTYDSAVPEILFVPVPEAWSPALQRTIRVLSGCMIVSILTGAIVAAFPVTQSTSAIAAAALAPLILGAATLLLVVMNSMVSNRRYRRLSAVDPSDDLPAATGRLLLSFGLFGRPTRGWITWKRFERERISRAIPPLRVVVDDALRQPLAAIPRPDHLVEPEQLFSGKVGVAHTIVTALCGIGAAWFLYKGSWLLGGFMGAWALVNLLDYSSLLGSVPIVDASLPVAGPGYVAIAPGIRMTVEDTTLIITRRKHGRSVQALLIGPVGVLGWKYPKLHDPQFVRLWQRWAHPHPRLDLNGDQD